MQTNLLFSTPVYNAELDNSDFLLAQEELKFVYDEHIHHNRFKDPWNNGRTGVTNGNFACNILDNCPNFKEILNKHINFFLDSIKEQRRDYIITASWMTQNLKGTYGHVHAHSPDELSGCYYFKKSENDGNIFFDCPIAAAEYSHIGKGFLLKRSITFQGKTGMLLLFPSWLNHGVDTNMSDNERISISFNITFK